MLITTKFSSPFIFVNVLKTFPLKIKMKSSPKLVSLAFLSLLVSCFAQLEDVSPSSSQIPATPTDANSAIKQWCNSTDYPDICIAAISPFLKGKPDLHVVVSIAINSAVEATKTAILAVKAIANSPITPPALKSILKDSLGSFEDAVDNFKQAQDALPLRDWGTVNTMLSGAMTDFGDCEDQLSGQDLPVLMDFSEKLTKMTSNCLALSSLLDPQPGF